MRRSDRRLFVGGQTDQNIAGGGLRAGGAITLQQFLAPHIPNAKNLFRLFTRRPLVQFETAFARQSRRHRG